MGRKSRSKVPHRTAPPPPPKAEARPTGTYDWAVVAGLAVLTAVVYAQVDSHQFLNYDDPQFVVDNPAVRAFDVRWALSSTSLTWLPLTWLSHMLDVALFGMHAGPQLLVNVVLHIASASFLFLALRQMTGRIQASAFVAALFAIHPAHVESVAWVAERKDVLSTFFAMLALLLWSRRQRGWTAVAMALSLLAKQTYVTLPFVLLLLDYWPLRRLRRASDLRELIVEKVPLFALSIVGIVAALAGQRGIGGMQTLEQSPLGQRIAIALAGYVRYLGKLFAPVHLALPYPLETVAPAIAIMAAVLLVAITAAAWSWRETAPWLLVGWLWFVGTLLPLIGLIQLGGAAIADRYTYFSFIGLFIAIAWTAEALSIPRPVLAAAAIAVVLVLAAVAFRQVSFWKDSDTLFTHAIEVTPPNPIAEYSLGQALQLSDPDRAADHLQRAIDLATPVLKQHHMESTGWYPQAYVALGTAMLMKARAMPLGPDRTQILMIARGATMRALQLDPSIPAARKNLQLAEQMEKDPRQEVDILLTEGTQLSEAGRFGDAVERFRKAVGIAPQSPEAHIYLGLGLIQAQKPQEGVAELRAAQAIDAAKANDFLTHALRWPPNPENLNRFISQVR